MHTGDPTTFMVFANDTIYRSHNGSIYDPPTTFKGVIDALNVYGIPVIVLIGLSGNMTSLMVFLWTPLSAMSSSVYLAALAVADIGFLVSLILSWTSWTELNLFHRHGWCPVIVYITYVFSFLSVWYVVSFTIERFIAVCYPFRRQILCTSRRAKIVVTSLAIFAMAFYSFAMWTSVVTVNPSTNLPECLPARKHYHLVTFFNNADSILTLIVPFLIISLFNARIALQIRSQRIARDRMRQESILTTPNGVHCRYDMTEIKITKMLLVVSSTFLILNLPSHVYRVYGFFCFILGHTYILTPSQTRWQELCQILYYITFSVNIFLYSMGGKNFRKALTQIRCCRRLRVRLGLESHWSMRRLGTESLTVSLPMTSSMRQHNIRSDTLSIQDVENDIKEEYDVLHKFT